MRRLAISSMREGGGDIDGPIERWKPDIGVVRATVQFSRETGRLCPSLQDIEADVSGMRTPASSSTSPVKKRTTPEQPCNCGASETASPRRARFQTPTFS